MKVNIIQASIPLFFLAIFIELLYVVWKRNGFYRLNDAISSLSLGITSQITGVATKLLLLGAYAAIETYASLQVWAGAPAWPLGNPFPAADTALGFGVAWPELTSFVVAFFLVDMAYYWFHRSAHSVNLAWASHVVHHSSEEYNLTTALRQSSTQTFFSMWFYFPLAFIGLPWELYTLSMGINLLYQFIIHTRTVGKLGFLEWFMNTPSHHRVHHGRNPKYIDRNHAGVFIIWDRMFGTFQQEEEEPTYGITKPLNSWNPIWANLHHYRDVFQDAARCRNPWDALKVLFLKPGWRPDYLGGPQTPPEVSRQTQVLYNPRIPRWLNLYGLLHFVAALGAALVVLIVVGGQQPTPWGLFLAGAFLVLITLSNLGSLFDGRKWAPWLEVARLTALVPVALFAFPEWSWALKAGGTAFLVFSMVAIWAKRHALPQEEGDETGVRVASTPKLEPELAKA